MKRTWPPPQVIFVGLELNQHGQAASQEQASSSCPVIFQGVLSFGSSVALAVESEQNSAAASAPNDDRKNDVDFISPSLQSRALKDNSISPVKETQDRYELEGNFKAGLASCSSERGAVRLRARLRRGAQVFVFHCAPSEDWSG